MDKSRVLNILSIPQPRPERFLPAVIVENRWIQHPMGSEAITYPGPSHCLHGKRGQGIPEAADIDDIEFVIGIRKSFQELS